MFPVGHVGLAVGAALAFEYLQSRRRLSAAPVPAPDNGDGGLKKHVRIDYRLVILGALLPDIIDKPLWFFSQGALIPSGRSYAHTLLFALILLIGGIILLRLRKKAGFLILALADMSHLILDEMWANPATLYWPSAGEFVRATNTSGWINAIMSELTPGSSHYPLIAIIGELMALLIILAVAWWKFRRKSVLRFIRTGLIR